MQAHPCPGMIVAGHHRDVDDSVDPLASLGTLALLLRAAVIHPA